MKMGKWARLLLLGTPILAGCSGFWQTPTSGSGSGGGCTTNCSTASSGNFYILNNGTTGQIAGYSIVSGKLTAISGSPWTLPGSAYAMAMGPGGSYLYASTDAGVFLYPINSTNGSLGTGTSIDTNDEPYSVQVDVTGHWLIEANPLTGGIQVNAIPITTSGAYVSGGHVYSQTYSSTAAALQKGQMAISQDNNYIFIAAGNAGTLIVPFNANAASGINPLNATAQLFPPVHSGGSALSVAVDPSATPRVFYIGETLANASSNSGALRVLSYAALANGAMTNVTNSPIATGTLSPSFILPAANGTYVYVANASGPNSAGNVGTFSLTNTGTSTTPTYSIGAGNTIAAGTLPIGLAVDSTSTYLLEVNQSGSPYFDSYTFDTTTLGNLDVQITANTGSVPVAVLAP